MSKANYLICSGEECPIRLTCRRFIAWLDNEEEDSDEMEPAFRNGTCERYLIKEYYGG